LIVALLFADPELASAQPLTVASSVTDISCFGMQDGAIDITISGGQAPYYIEWSNSTFDEDLTELAAGFYAVYVKDDLGEEVRKEFTLTEPVELQAEVSVQVYPNGFNLSCYQCFNGSISVFPVGGTAPYAYAWQDGALTQHRYNLGPVQTSVTVTDAHNCYWDSQIFTLTSPERSDWTMSGNAGTNPATQYIGTSDSKDLVFRTQGTERLRVKANGELKAADLQLPSGYSLLVADSTGTVKSLNNFSNLTWTSSTWAKWCALPWTLCGTTVGPNSWLGTLNDVPLRLRTHNVERMVIDTQGKVGIGTTPPINGSSYHLYVDQGIAAREVKVTAGTWPDYVFEPNYQLLSFDQLRSFIGAERHLPGMLTEKEVQSAQGFELGDTQTRMLRLVEEQTLYILLLEERLARAEALLAKLLNDEK